MPKTTEGKKYSKSYTENDLLKALTAIESGMPKREASKLFHIPRATIQFRLSNKFVKSSPGPPTILTSQEESILVDWIKECHRKGFPRRKDDVQASVKQFLDEKPRPNPFKGNYPGEGWYKAFIKRHPDISIRTSEAVTAASANISENDIRKWFQQIYNYLQEEGYEHILNHAERVFNGDETNFLLCPENKKVLVPKGARNVYEVDGGKAKSALTVMFTFNARGNSTPPQIIYPYKRLPREISESVPPTWGVACSDSGWMKKEIFYEYISKIFYPNVRKLNIQFPIILFVDGHQTHLDKRLSDLCTKLDIILVCLYPNATRLLQPCDVSTFKPLKDGWRKGVIRWRRENPMEELTKVRFASLLDCVIKSSVKPEIIISGFRTCGLFPWNVEAIDFTKCLGKTTRNSDNKKSILEEDKLNTSALSYKTFQRIVGEKRIHTFKQIDNLLDDDDDNVILYQLWKAFQDRNEITQSDNNEVDLPEENNNRRSEEDYSNLLPIVNCSDYPSVESVIDYYDILNMPIVIDENPVEEIRPEELVSLPSKFPFVSEQHKVLVHKTEDGVDVIQVSREEVLITASSKSLVASEDKILIQEKGNSVEDLDAIQIMCTEQFVPSVPESTCITDAKISTEHKGDSLRDYLHWPTTPERKGKRKTESMPFVLTASEWKRKTAEKDEAKLNEIKAKENRKREREAKKIVKELSNQPKRQKGNGKTGKAKSKVNIISSVTIPPTTAYQKTIKSSKYNFTNQPIDSKICQEEIFNDPIFEKNMKIKRGLCYICASNITMIRSGIKCYKCARSFHINCLIKHQPNLNSNEIYYCKSCTQQNNAL